MDRDEKEAIRSRIDIVEVVSGYTTLKKAGRNYKGLCPFHQEKTPSFTVDAERGLWRCFGSCSAGGDVFSFLMRAEGLSFPEAAERLAERAGVKLAHQQADPQARERSDERDRIYAANALAVRFFRDSFGRARLAQDYADKRGLVHETLEAFAIGFAPDGWGALADYLAKNGVHMADAEKAGLVFPSRNNDGSWRDKFWGRLIFPIVDVQERVVGFGGRLLIPSENAPKYLNSPETPVFSKSRVLYALNRARRAVQEHDRVVVVEGYMDAVAAHQAGFPHVVATLGTSLTDEHIRLLGRYTKNVVLSFDADDAGVRAALKAADLFAGAGDGSWTLRILALPPGEDPDSLLARGDAPAFHKAIESALTVPEFRLQVLQARYDPSNEQDKQAFIREALPILADVSSHIERDKIIHRLARYHHNYATAGSARAQESLRDEFREYLSRSGREPTMPPLDAPPRADAQPVRLRGETVLPPGRRPGGHTGFRPQETFTRSGGQRRWVPTNNMPEPPPAAPRRTAADVAERTLLRALLSDEWTQAVRGRVTPEDFPDAETVRLVDALLPLIEGGIAPSEALRELSDAVLADHANALLLAPDDDAPLSEPLITDCLYALEMRRRRGEIGEIRAQAAPDPEGKRDGDDELLRRWEQKARAMKAPRPADHGG